MSVSSERSYRENEGSFNILKEEAYERIFSTRNECYMLIDPMLIEHKKDRGFFFRLSGSNYIKTALPHPELDGVMELWLVLLKKEKTDDCELLELSLHHALGELQSENLLAGEGRSVCGWITSELNIEAIAEDLSRSAIQKRPSGGFSLIRYYDPSVLGAMMEIIDPWQRKRLLANIDSWTWINGDGELCTVYGSGNAANKMDFSLGLTEYHLAELKKVISINKILRKYRRSNSHEVIKENQAIKMLLPALDYFSAHFSQMDDGMVEFGIDVLTINTDFYKHKKIERYFINYEVGSLPGYCNCKAMIKKNEWQSMLAELQG
ncbi:DUF4123 domain-containing protein [Lonsdalea quercina]|uniref:DUF4123 domain-containing protein n=1 Tax=Lonsdalea quercina TaxID=71657 RepID=UPI0039766ED0